MSLTNIVSSQQTIRGNAWNPSWSCIPHQQSFTILVLVLWLYTASPWQRFLIPLQCCNWIQKPITGTGNPQWRIMSFKLNSIPCQQNLFYWDGASWEEGLGTSLVSQKCRHMKVAHWSDQLSELCWNGIGRQTEARLLPRHRNNLRSDPKV